MEVTRVLQRAEVDKLLVDILQKENIIQPHIEVSAGASKGDGYLSFITRADITGENKDLNLVIKCAPTSKDIRKFVPIKETYEREIMMYDNVFPLLQSFQKSLEEEQQFKGFTKCYKCIPTDGEEKIVLENIKTKGFVLWDRKKQMTEELVEFVLREYGKYHALCYTLKDQQPEQYQNVANRMSDIWRKVWESGEAVDAALHCIDYVLKVMQPSENELVYEAVRAYSKKFVDYQTAERAKGKFTVISHGDCWCNNMMFKFGDTANPTKPTEIRLLDFQLSDDTSPAYDLAYFLYVSAPKSVLDNLDDFLRIYYDSLASFTKALGTDVSKFLTFDELLEQWKPASKFGYNMFATVIKALYQEDEEIVDLHDYTSGKITAEELHSRKMIHEDVIEQRIRDMTLHMYNRGFFED